MEQVGAAQSVKSRRRLAEAALSQPPEVVKLLAKIMNVEVPLAEFGRFEFAPPHPANFSRPATTASPMPDVEVSSAPGCMMSAVR